MDSLVSGLEFWLDDQPVMFPTLDNVATDSDPQLPFEGFTDQTGTGWENFLCRRLATSWFTAHNKKRTSRGSQCLLATLMERKPISEPSLGHMLGSVSESWGSCGSGKIEH